MKHFFAYMARMKYIKRWGLMRSNQEENIQEHSLQTAMIAHALAVIGNTVYGKNYDENRIAVLAMYHEAGEVLTGDLPTPIKYYNPEINGSYKAIESLAEEKLLNMLPDVLQGKYLSLVKQPQDEAHRIVKYADKLCAYLKCVEEVRGGNREFEKAKRTIAAELDEITAPEVRYFIKEFAGSFELTLDELG